MIDFIEFRRIRPTHGF